MGPVILDLRFHFIQESKHKIFKSHSILFRYWSSMRLGAVFRKKLIWEPVSFVPICFSCQDPWLTQGCVFRKAILWITKKFNSQYFFFYCTNRLIWNMVMKIVNCRTHWLPLSWMCKFLQKKKNKKKKKRFDVSDDKKGPTKVCLMRQNFCRRFFFWRK